MLGLRAANATRCWEGLALRCASLLLPIVGLRATARAAAAARVAMGSGSGGDGAGVACKGVSAEMVVIVLLPRRMVGWWQQCGARRHARPVTPSRIERQNQGAVRPLMRGSDAMQVGRSGGGGEGGGEQQQQHAMAAEGGGGRRGAGVVVQLDNTEAGQGLGGGVAMRCFGHRLKPQAAAKGGEWIR